MRAKLTAVAPEASPLGAIDNATLNHLHLRVDDLDVAQDFYERHFGWEPVMEIPGAQRTMRFLRDKKGFLLVLEMHPDKSPVPRWFHLGFELPSRANVRTAAEHFTKQGIALLDPLVDTKQFASFTIADPDGYHIQVYWDASPGSA